MQTVIDQKSEKPRSEARRTQIQLAAVKCFKQHGFHSASMAQISKSAGMSVGHIYHYFKNKEAIIADIVDQNIQSLLALASELLLNKDIKVAILDQAIHRIKIHSDQNTAALQIEIMAEAARNPTIAKIVQSANQLMRENLAKIIHSIRQADGHHDSNEDIIGMAETLIAMFDGLCIRTICNPKRNQRALIKIFKQTIHRMLFETLEKTKL